MSEVIHTLIHSLGAIGAGIAVLVALRALSWAKHATAIAEEAEETVAERDRLAISQKKLLEMDVQHAELLDATQSLRESLKRINSRLYQREKRDRGGNKPNGNDADPKDALREEAKRRGYL